LGRGIDGGGASGGRGGGSDGSGRGGWSLVTAPDKTIWSEVSGGGGRHVPHATGQVVRAME
jgi:hypothetical protein